MKAHIRFRPASFAAALAFSLAASTALAARIVPAEPSAFERVNLRMTVDSCAFAPGTVRVTASGNVLTVTQQLNQCLVAGSPEVADVGLGALPAGDYRVEIFASPRTDGTPAESLAFQVRERPEIAIFPPPPRPLADYSGMWWSPRELGWGLSIHQSPTHVVFAAWFVYGPNGQPEWFTLQDGSWTSSTTWAGTVFRTSGPFFAGPTYDPRSVIVANSGAATIDFKQLPGQEDLARLTYTLDGIATTKTIARMVF